MDNSKKQAVLKKGKSSPLIYILPIGLLALGTMLFFIFQGPGNNGVSELSRAFPETGNQKVQYHQVTPVDDQLRFDLSRFDSGQVQYFTVHRAGVDVNFFVLKSSDGVIRSAFDACDVCYRSRRGYSQLGDMMVCNNCGQQFSSVKINVEQGGCNPSPLERTIEGQVLVISLDALDQGKRYF